MAEEHTRDPMPPPAFVLIHCQHCAAGWTRTGKGGKTITLCLLDRARVWPDLTGCDRYEPMTDSPA
jgi:hypothetical protein